MRGVPEARANIAPLLHCAHYFFFLENSYYREDGYGPMKIGPDEIGHIIQLAIAPVFLLTGVGTNMLVLTNRLARIIDRYRAIEERINGWDGQPAKQASATERTELDMLFKRAQKINRAIFLSTSCALLICMVVATLFIADALNLRLSLFIASLFVLAMMALTASFIYLLREVFLATGFLDEQHRRSANQPKRG